MMHILRPDIIGYSAAISACEKADWEQAGPFFLSGHAQGMFVHQPFVWYQRSKGHLQGKSRSQGAMNQQAAAMHKKSSQKLCASRAGLGGSTCAEAD